MPIQVKPQKVCEASHTWSDFGFVLNVLRLLQINLRNIAEVGTVVRFIKKAPCNTAWPLRCTRGVPCTGLQCMLCLDLGCLLGLIEIGRAESLSWLRR